MILFSCHSGKGKVIGTKRNQWLPGAEGRNKVLVTRMSQFWELLELFENRS